MIVAKNRAILMQVRSNTVGLLAGGGIFPPSQVHQEAARPRGEHACCA
jgi:hypothetical protein